jgi:RNA polymerase sigma-70 factor (ECF subfamily)
MRESAAHLRGILFRTRSEEWLFGRAIRGDALAFSEVYRRYHSRVYGFSLSRLLDPAMAEEATQETFVRLLSADPDSIASPKSWLFGVARNVCLELGRQPSNTDDLAEIEASLIAPESLDEMRRQELRQNIVLALRRMRPRYRSALILRELHGLSSIEIADVLATTPGAVDTIVCRSRDAFGKAYAEVSDLPDACAQVVPLIYKRTGTGLSRREESRLSNHVDACPSCRREERRAAARDMLASVLPLLTNFGLESEPARLSNVLRHLDPSLASVPYELIPSGSRIWAKVAATLAVCAALVVPATSLMPGPEHRSLIRTRSEESGTDALMRPEPRRLAEETPAPSAFGSASYAFAPRAHTPSPNTGSRRPGEASRNPSGDRPRGMRVSGVGFRGKADVRGLGNAGQSGQQRRAKSPKAAHSTRGYRNAPSKRVKAATRKQKPDGKRSVRKVGKRASRCGRT